MELWVYLARGRLHLLILKWKEWESSEQFLYIKTIFFKRENAATGFAVGL